MEVTWANEQKRVKVALPEYPYFSLPKPGSSRHTETHVQKTKTKKPKKKGVGHTNPISLADILRPESAAGDQVPGQRISGSFIHFIQMWQADKIRKTEAKGSGTGQTTKVE